MYNYYHKDIEYYNKKMGVVHVLFHNKSNSHLFMWMPDLYLAQMIHLACTSFPKISFPAILQSMLHTCHMEKGMRLTNAMIWLVLLE